MNAPTETERRAREERELIDRMANQWRWEIVNRIQTARPELVSRVLDMLIINGE
jgi:hypothetical protein